MNNCETGKNIHWVRASSSGSIRWKRASASGSFCTLTRPRSIAFTLSAGQEVVNNNPHENPKESIRNRVQIEKNRFKSETNIAKSAQNNSKSTPKSLFFKDVPLKTLTKMNFDGENRASILVITRHFSELCEKESADNSARCSDATFFAGRFRV